VSVESAAYIALAALIVAAIALLLAIWLLLRTRRLSRMSTFRPEMPAHLQDSVERERQRLDQLSALVQETAARLPAVESRASTAIQRVGIVRFNPFEDTGGQQSFALAMLDWRGTGFVVSSLHSRQATRLYLKQITDGRSEAQLSEEEAGAVRGALAGETAP
jgi:uncharacterized protein YlxW (UPF0749 family)